MNFLEKIVTGVQKFFVATPFTPQVTVDKQPDLFRRVSKNTISMSFGRGDTGILNTDYLKQAISMAMNPPFYSKFNLMKLYEILQKDDDVFAEWQTRSFQSLAEDFLILVDGKENKDLKEQISGLVWQTLFNQILEAILFGFTVSEMSFTSGILTNIEILDRLYINNAFGLITPNPMIATGYDYRQNPFVLEFGNYKNFGLLEIVAKLVIRKEYSASDWSLLSEKFGMPFIALMLNTSDQAEIDNAVRTFGNMGRAGVANLTREDEIKFLESTKTDPYKIYLESINKNATQISKVITGQSDASNSSQNGSNARAQVHENRLKDRFWFDINYIQNCVNYEFFPKLSKFKGFEKYANAKLEFKVWSQTPNIAVPNVNAIANIPIPKKKSLISTKAFDFENLLLEFWAIFEVIIGKVYKGEAISEDKKTLFNQTLNTLKTGIKEGFNDLKIKPNPELAKKINENLSLFSQAKTNENLLKLNQGLLDSNGDRVSFAKFKELAQELNQTYNLTYLKTEYDLAFTSAQMAAKWQTFEKSKDKYDLRYVSVNDKRTRDSHRSLNGIVKPVDDPFWDSYYPPNGYRCRCTVERVLKGTEGKQVSELPEVPKIFNTNVGKTGIVFPEKFAYLNTENNV